VPLPTILRALGKDFPVDVFVQTTTLPVTMKYRRGDPITTSSTQTCRDSGIAIDISRADWHEFDRQVSDSTLFLGRHWDEIVRLIKFDGVEEAWVDFGVGWSKDGAHYYRWPADFITMLADLGLALEVSHYPTNEPSAGMQT
jgi:hypothetical protein